MSKASKFFGKTLIDNILADYRRKKFKDQGTLEKTLVWDDKKLQLLAPTYFQTLIDGQGRKSGKGAPVSDIIAWVRRRRIQFRNFVTGRFRNLRETSFLVNMGLREKGSQVFQGRREGVDMEKATNDALDKGIEAFGDEIIELFNKKK